MNSFNLIEKSLKQKIHKASFKIILLKGNIILVQNLFNKKIHKYYSYIINNFSKYNFRFIELNQFNCF
jgi:hypothetical protein